MSMCVVFFFTFAIKDDMHTTHSQLRQIYKGSGKKIHCLEKTEAEMSLFFGLFYISTAFSLFTTVHFVLKFEYTSAPLGMHTSNCYLFAAFAVYFILYGKIIPVSNASRIQMSTDNCMLVDTLSMHNFWD